MKKILILLAFVPFMHITSLAQESVKFQKWFTDQTLRIDYLRIGNKQGDIVELQNYIKRQDFWAGSKKNLIDPFDNGIYQIVVQDSATDRVLYTRGYNTLFREYCDTPDGENKIGKFEEVVNIPFPHRTIKINLLKRDRYQKLKTQTTWIFNPAKTNYINDRNISKEKIEPIKLVYNGQMSQKYDLAIVAQGYEQDSSKALSDLKKLTDNLFQQTLFKSRASDFNVWGIMGNSGAEFNTFGADRYLMTTHLFQLHTLLTDTPYDMIIIMVNNEVYGGGAIYNFYAVTSTNEMSNMILPHELGHGIGGLADEYVDETLSYNNLHPTDVEPMEPNITTLVNFESKWKDMLPKDTKIPTEPVKGLGPKENGPIGVYEGGGYQKKGVYRPVTNCMMNYYAEFCPVCTKRMNEIIDLYCH